MIAASLIAAIGYTIAAGAGFMGVMGYVAVMRGWGDEEVTERDYLTIGTALILFAAVVALASYGAMAAFHG